MEEWKLQLGGNMNQKNKHVVNKTNANKNSDTLLFVHIDLSLYDVERHVEYLGRIWSVYF